MTNSTELQKGTYMELREIIGKKLLFFDGGMGTMLQKNGLGSGDIPEYLNITNPGLIQDIHEQYLRAGADFVTTNTFGANILKLTDSEYTVAELTAAAVKCARTAAEKYSSPEKPRFVALDIGPSGKLLEPIGNVSFDEAYESFRVTVEAGVSAGADCIIIETMSDTQEARAAVLAAKENSSLPVFCTMTFDETGKTLTGGTAEIAGAVLEGLRVDCVGINCGLGPAQIRAIAEEMINSVSVPVMVQPNAGLPQIEDGRTVYNVGPEEFAAEVREIARMGVSIIGGCCGTTPEYIRAVAAACEGMTPMVRESKKTIVTSYCRCVEIGKRPVIIGERINPTGKKKFKEALKNNDIDYILGEALKQEEAGADILDVNVGLPEIDEVKMMCSAVDAVAATAALPLQIDSSEPEVIEAALRRYNGRALINSVNGKREVLDAVLPIAAKYGGVVVGLALDENGIPETAEERVKIAERIIAAAESCGIKKKDVIIDPLTLTISAQQKEAWQTVKALGILKAMGINTVLGVSNISFGLPRRELINSTFFALALSSGLSACIINPCSAPMMDTYRSYLALTGLDENCSGYISEYTGTAAAQQAERRSADARENTAAEERDPLYGVIIKGLSERSFAEAEKLLEEREPMDIINSTIIPALDKVGAEFEAGTMFLPQLMMSAQTVTNAFEAIKQYFEKTGKKAQSKGKVAIATVKGDIHDIGKNIVKTLLENYGYDVFDLGKDVDIDLIIDTLKREDIHLLGLSALMTTTVASMEKTIKAVRAECPGVKIFVGGAVLNEDYANMIGADKYTKDALASVAYAGEILGKE